METEMRPSFASLLKEHRRACGLSQEKLAEAAGLSREAIGLLERGARRSPRRDTVTLLARTLNLSDNERARLLGRCGHAAIGSLKQPELVLIVAATFDELYRQAGGDRRGR